ncbi:MAG: DUF2628 domain-containing protein [Clostridia bacterium]|nr:DUF2628 domain-containing protein [Clostridia bacterium]MBQ6708311.1 DUF2628 domain-containing protein [Clostridia bacterium]
MKYIGEKCPVCDNIFAEGEDIVVCPECGTPFHRECWNNEGRCINEDKHGEFVWSPKKDIIEVEPLSSADSTISKLCPVCSSRNDENATVCKSCGHTLSDDEPKIFTDFQGFGQNAPDSDKEIDGVKASKIIRYVQINYHRYLDKFSKKFSFNWAAFFFNPFWFFYRKLYYVGGIFIGIQLLISILIAFFMNRLGLTEVMVSYMEAASSGSVEAMQTALLSLEPYMTEFSVLALISALPNIIVGFIADRIYKRKAFKDIKKIDESGEAVNPLSLAKHGAGVSILAAGLSYIGYNVLTNLLSTLL